MSEKKINAVIIGATGLIGSHIWSGLKAEESVRSIKLISRRDIPVHDNKTELAVIDFEDLSAYKNALKGADWVFCAVGTTRKKVDGDQKKYRKVDYDIPVNAARFAAHSGVQYFGLVSSVGADSSSRSFYLKLKGEVEEYVSKESIPSINIFRPSMLLGDRSEFRLGELIGKILMVPFSFLIPSKYKPVKGRTVARAMIQAASLLQEGFHVYHYNKILELGRK